jgi:tetratricopeptide (TPR) repeat protein
VAEPKLPPPRLANAGKGGESPASSRSPLAEAEGWEADVDGALGVFDETQPRRTSSVVPVVPEPITADPIAPPAAAADAGEPQAGALTTLAPSDESGALVIPDLEDLASRRDLRPPDLTDAGVPEVVAVAPAPNPSRDPAAAPLSLADAEEVLFTITEEPEGPDPFETPAPPDESYPATVPVNLLGLEEADTFAPQGLAVLIPSEGLAPDSNANEQLDQRRQADLRDTLALLADESAAHAAGAQERPHDQATASEDVARASFESALISRVAGHHQEARTFCRDAMGLAPGGAAALRESLCLEFMGPGRDGARVATALAALAALPLADRNIYEWLARHLASLPEGEVTDGEVDLADFNGGVAADLTRAARALRADATSTKVTTLARAARAMGGAAGSALLSLAARIAERSPSATSPVAQGANAGVPMAESLRAESLALDPHHPGERLADLRQLAGLAAELASRTPLRTAPPATLTDAIGKAAMGALAGLETPALRAAVARWAAAVVPERGADLLSLGVAGVPLEALALSDRIGLLPALLAGETASDSGTARRPGDGLTEGLSLAEATILTAAMAEELVRTDRAADAVSALVAGLERAPDAVILALLAERLVAAVPDHAGQALALWSTADPARKAVAEMRRAAWLDAHGHEGAARTARLAAVRAAPHDSVFLSYAWHEITGRHFAAAAAVLAEGAAAWKGPGLESLHEAIVERAEDLRQAEVPAHAVVRALGRSSSVEEALDHPRTLALALLENGKDVAATGALLRSAAMGSRAMVPRVYEAATFMIAAGRRRDAVQFLQPRWSERPLSEAAEVFLRRLVMPFEDPESSVAVLERLEADAHEPLARAALAFRRAEILGRAGHLADCADLFRELAAGPLRFEADWAYRRWLWSAANGSALDALCRDEADAYRGAAQTASASRAIAERARVRAELIGDTAGARTLEREAVAVDPANLEAQLACWLEAARAQDRSGVLAGLSFLATQREVAEGATLLRLLLEETWRDGRDRTVWLSAAMHAAREPRLILLARTLTADAPASVFEDAAMALLALPEGDRRLPASLLVRAAGRHREASADARARAAGKRCLENALAVDPDHLPAVRLLVETVREDNNPARDAPVLFELLLRQSALVAAPGHKAKLLVEAAVLALERLSDPRHAEDLLRRALDADPGDGEAFRRLRVLLEARADHGALVALLESRAKATTDPDEAASLSLSRAEMLLAAGDRAGARDELRRLLAAVPQNPTALTRLSALEFADGAFAIAAELLLRLARIETDPAALESMFRRLGHIYSKRMPDPKLAIGAYERLLKLAPADIEALSSLSELYAKQNDLRRAVVTTEQALAHEPDGKRRLALSLRLASLHERRGDLRRAGALLKGAVEEAPRSLQAIGELARFYERTKENQARRVLLDTSMARLREDLKRDPGELGALRTIVPLLRWRKRDAGSTAAAQLLGALTDDVAEVREVGVWAKAPPRGRRLTPLANPEVDDLAYPSTLPPGLRQVMRLIGPTLAKLSKPDLKRYGLARGDRVGVGEGPRAFIDPLAVDVGVRGFEVYVCPQHPTALVVEPGDPPAIIMGGALVDLGPAAIRFIGGYALRLIATHFDLLLAPGPDAGMALLPGLMRHFTSTADLHGIDPERVAEAYARLGKVLTRTMRSELSVFVAEIATPFGSPDVGRAIEELAARVGLLASGDLAASLKVLLMTRGDSLRAASLASFPLAGLLFDFTLSPEYEVLVRALDSVS